MACSLIERLNSLADKTPDQIAKSLFNPWVRLGTWDYAFFEANHHRIISLYNIRDHCYLSGISDFERRTQRRMDYWPRSTICSSSQCVHERWFVCLNDEAIPFIEGVHDA